MSQSHSSFVNHNFGKLAVVLQKLIPIVKTYYVNHLSSWLSEQDNNEDVEDGGGDGDAGTVR